MKKRNVYLDHAASTPVDKAVLKKMLPYFSEKYGNPSSIHIYGQEARKAVETARQNIADFLGCDVKEIIFTSGATEASAWVIKSALKTYIGQSKPHIIVSSIEHHSIYDLSKWLANNGVEVTFLKVSNEGLINSNDIEKAIKKNTILVSIIYAHNEIGSIQPIPEISKVIRQANKKRESNKIIFHTDAVQAANYINCNVRKLGVDLMTLCSHKVYGPKGTGALYIRSGIYLEPLIGPGSQEFSLRPGTENVPGIVGFGEAIKKIKKDNKLIKLRDRLINGILKNIPDTELNGPSKNRLPNNVNISFIGAEGESILMALSQKGIYVSTGSACASRSLASSHILTAIGLPPEKAHCSVRFTFGKQTTSKDIDYVIETLPKIISRLRKISGGFGIKNKKTCIVKK